MLRLGIKASVMLGVLLVPGSFIIAAGAWMYQYRKRASTEAGASARGSRSACSVSRLKRNMQLGQLPAAWPFNTARDFAAKNWQARVASARRAARWLHGQRATDGVRGTSSTIE